MRKFHQARDKNGSFGIDWTMLEEADGQEAPTRMEFIPFAKGDARVPSIPADETMYCGVGQGHLLTYAVIALRVGERAVHVAMTPVRLRQFASALVTTADLIESRMGDMQ